VETSDWNIGCRIQQYLQRVQLGPTCLPTPHSPGAPFSITGWLLCSSWRPFTSACRKPTWQWVGERSRHTYKTQVEASGQVWGCEEDKGHAELAGVAQNAKYSQGLR